jgi:dienelactone hydrolase
MRGELFKFTNTSGRVIKGMLYGTPTRGIGVIYLPNIVLGATAVHRLGIELARELARDGHVACLFDPTGIGESEGDYPAGTCQQLCAWIESGACVDDTLETIDYLTRSGGVRRVVLVGHCGGALTAIYATAKHPAVSAALLISPPMHRAAAQREDAGGRSSYRTITQLLVAQARRQLARIRGVRVDGPPPSAYNERLLQALATTRADGKTLSIVFGDRDLEYKAFLAFQREHLADDVAVRVFEDTSHGFVTEESQALLFAEIRVFANAATALRAGAAIQRHAIVVPEPIFDAPIAK